MLQLRGLKLISRALPIDNQTAATTTTVTTIFDVLFNEPVFSALLQVTRGQAKSAGESLWGCCSRFITGWMPFLSLNQTHQITEDNQTS